MNDTIWSLTEDDIRMVLDDKFPELDAQKKEYLVERARHKFDIPDWYDMVVAFIEARLDEVEDWGEWQKST